MNSQWIRLQDKTGNFDLVYDNGIEPALVQHLLDAGNPAIYKDLIGLTRDNENVKTLITDNFWEEGDFDAADPPQVVAFFKEDSENQFEDPHAWMTLPLFVYYKRVVEDIGEDVIDAVYKGRVVSTDELWRSVVSIMIYMTYPAAYTATVVDAPVVAAEPSVTPEPSLAQRFYAVVQSVAAVPVKAAAAVANIVMGEPVAQNVASVVDAVIEPVAAAVEVVAPAPETKPLMLGNPYDMPVATSAPAPAPSAPATPRGMPANPYDMPFTTSASPVQQAANAVTAMLTGSSTTAVTGRTDFDRAKSKFYRAYRNQPNGRTADRNKAAKTVVTDVAKYVPKRNDFKGLDDRTGTGAFAPARKRK